MREPPSILLLIEVSPFQEGHDTILIDNTPWGPIRDFFRDWPGFYDNPPTVILEALVFKFMTHVTGDPVQRENPECYYHAAELISAICGLEIDPIEEIPERNGALRDRVRDRVHAWAAECGIHFPPFRRSLPPPLLVSQSVSTPTPPP